MQKIGNSAKHWETVKYRCIMLCLVGPHDFHNLKSSSGIESLSRIESLSLDLFEDPVCCCNVDQAKKNIERHGKHVKYIQKKE